MSGARRFAAFSATEYMMNLLKTRAPFWKWETIPVGSRWLDARASDQEAGARSQKGHTLLVKQMASG